jgi:hypothetical protein
MQSLPGSDLEVIETELFFQLLVCLLANPSCLDGSSQGAQRSLRRQVGEIVFLLSGHPVFADEPNLLPRQMLLTLVPDPLRRSVGDPHAPCGKSSFKLAPRAGRRLLARLSPVWLSACEPQIWRPWLCLWASRRSTYRRGKSVQTTGTTSGIGPDNDCWPV